MRLGRMLFDHDVFTGPFEKSKIERKVTVRVIFRGRAKNVRFSEWVFEPVASSPNGLVVEAGLVVSGYTVHRPSDNEECLWIGDARPSGQAEKQEFIPWNLIKKVVEVGEATA